MLNELKHHTQVHLHLFVSMWYIQRSFSLYALSFRFIRNCKFTLSEWSASERISMNVISIANLFCSCKTTTHLFSFILTEVAPCLGQDDLHTLVLAVITCTFLSALLIIIFILLIVHRVSWLDYITDLYCIFKKRKNMPSYEDSRFIFTVSEKSFYRAKKSQK